MKNKKVLKLILSKSKKQALIFVLATKTELIAVILNLLFKLLKMYFE